MDVPIESIGGLFNEFRNRRKISKEKGKDVRTYIALQNDE